MNSGYIKIDNNKIIDMTRLIDKIDDVIEDFNQNQTILV